MTYTVVCMQARGIDIPSLDNVINYNFPAKPKLFVHRVGEEVTLYPLLGYHAWLIVFRPSGQSREEWLCLYAGVLG